MRIDHGHHDGKAVKALNDAVAMNKAVAKALEIVNKGKPLPIVFYQVHTICIFVFHWMITISNSFTITGSLPAILCHLSRRSRS